MTQREYRAIAYAGINVLTRTKRYLKTTTDTAEQAELELTKLLHPLKPEGTGWHPGHQPRPVRPSEPDPGRRAWLSGPTHAQANGSKVDRMPSRRYQMSSSERADILVRALDLDDTFRASRPIGYAYVRVVDVEHPCEACPDHLVHAVDPLARIERVYPDIPEPTT